MVLYTTVWSSVLVVCIALALLEGFALGSLRRVKRDFRVGFLEMLKRKVIGAFWVSKGRGGLCVGFLLELPRLYENRCAFLDAALSSRRLGAEALMNMVPGNNAS